jgi:hypothetical protein
LPDLLLVSTNTFGCGSRIPEGLVMFSLSAEHETDDPFVKPVRSLIKNNYKIILLYELCNKVVLTEIVIQFS